MSAEETKPAPPPVETHVEPPKPVAPARVKRRRWVLPLIIVLALVTLWFGIPIVVRTFTTVSTDDAYVNSYVTFVAPRVAGQVARVLVDDNNRVEKGDVLVELDPEPFKVQVAIKQSAVDTAQAALVVAEASTRSDAAQVRSGRFKLERAIEDVDNQIATIHARVATWEQAKATLVLARAEFERAQRLFNSKVVSPEEYDQKREALDVATAQVKQSLQDIYEARVALGLPPEPTDGTTLNDVPANLDQNFSSVREALANLLQSAARLGIQASSFDLTPAQTIAEFLKRDPSGDINRIYAQIIRDAPNLKQAQANLAQALRDLDQAKLDLRYCTIFAEIDGVIIRRNVNPGNYVQVGQTLMAIRSLRDIWVDANFKETQLGNLRIGQRVDLKLDMYGGHRRFEGRISGFTNGTGSTLSLLPAENATGNFVKVVQRLPVRIDVTNYDPDKFPLFVGLSVTPIVDLTSAPTGPDAGKFLQTAPVAPASQPSPTP
ncbi:MAG: efflux RND transporter periplasmic adaptor subunit [Verrucomicrobia bacterium]|nr:efflux RND transporter periplasmic adaptor subunit [Verrucomicrobiota bacterium]